MIVRLDLIGGDKGNGRQRPAGHASWRPYRHRQIAGVQLLVIAHQEDAQTRGARQFISPREGAIPAEGKAKPLGDGLRRRNRGIARGRGGNNRLLRVWRGRTAFRRRCNLLNRRRRNHQGNPGGVVEGDHGRSTCGAIPSFHMPTPSPRSRPNYRVRHAARAWALPPRRVGWSGNDPEPAQPPPFLSPPG